MYLTQKCQIRDLSKQEFLALRELCHLSKNLYNVGLYSVRQFFFAESRYLRYESNYHHCKSNENYRHLNTDIAQQTLKVVDRSFRSFFNLIKTAKHGLYRFEQIRLPGYLPKDSYFPLIMPRIKVKDGFFEIPMSNEFRKEFGSVRIPFPSRLVGKKLKQVRILPRYKARFFEVEYIVEAEPEPQPVDPKNQLAIDLGLDNLASCVSTTGASFIMDGKPLKSFNQWFNKENARLQSIKDLQGIKGTTERQARLTINRNNRLRDYLNKTARYIIDWCVKHKVGTLIVGVNPGMKQEINIGSRNNQNFVQIPHWSLRNKLKALCQRYGLTYLEQEESYTSKASFLDGDGIPTYNPDNPQDYKFSGKRIKRGLYRSRSGHLVSADANGAANIGRKCSLDGFNLERVVAVLAQPLRVKIS
ncbi:MAG: transposase [Kastovskya adunca ATA6-11-RM4]|jgi:IS605 OrfB family transposase|nr:transposase [Kastovskya adunca ATA6-11-RM4]